MGGIASSPAGQALLDDRLRQRYEDLHRRSAEFLSTVTHTEEPTQPAHVDSPGRPAGDTEPIRDPDMPTPQETSHHNSRLSSLSQEMQSLAGRARQAMTQGDHAEADRLLREGEHRAQEGTGVLAWIQSNVPGTGTGRRSMSATASRMAVKAVVPYPCRMGLYCCAKCCCCCCYPRQWDDYVF
eukprot:Blabericola_migrator_1__3062@NODE_1893_length_3597_cov_98_220397_g1213_i0_p3_GENE_NODE_1893_length_3597_cov_98_220397_g1213_i0NODE_1893_length_3597_cov_98_220397_g1213_i0_p3_ORF_typecomplete_len183_score24_65TPR_MalT/PF17874_1/0_00094HrpB1_HrpK/PF09613_10/0_025LUC7/PF03194_15/0_043DUF1771/PF08590_10/1_6e03DUF1771/PF08590_10/0_084_NODE_1893_length_3597_cov_98_220397_g1213_i0327875